LRDALTWTLSILLAMFAVLSWLSLDGCGHGSCHSGAACNCATGGGQGVSSCNAEGQLIECRCDAVNMEGGACSPSDTPQGSCLDASNVCKAWNAAMAADVVASCIRPCMSDGDCAASPVGHVCATVDRDEKACVSMALGEGQRVDTSLSHMRPMTGCQSPLQAVHRLSGSLLLDLDDDQASCGRACSADGECTGTAHTCTLGVLSSSTAPGQLSGICTIRRAGKGARCSTRSIIGACDTGLSQNMVCTDLGLEDADNQGDADKFGLCVEICDMVDTTCRATPDGAHMPKCEFGFFNDQTLGICDDRCNAFPDNCTGMGSPPSPGDTARGAHCIPFRGSGSFDMPDQALCIDVEQHGATLPIYDFKTTPAASCDQNTIACPDKTVCVGADPASGFSVCVYGCTTSGGTSGCEATGFPTCKADLGNATKAGICEPSTSG
jgi:hypothetical protein